MKLNRRKFIKRLVIAIASVEAFFLVRHGITKKTAVINKESLVFVGEESKFFKNNTYPFLSDQFYLKRFDDGGFMAFSVKCTHLGCVVNINTKTGGFNCPCHASRFDSYGNVLSAPAARPLDIFPIVVKGKELYVNTQKAIIRQSFDQKQITYV
ncbi:MAG: Rieske 2Fe-2S domain-containing protein [Bacteroidetes bacterium]|jgi:nitrite reductase/ring-hydroxylating ferredoxin subunit|nr:Rieske 2Fe-2S domain-containing protein [Bacteroidota bacterium]